MPDPHCLSKVQFRELNRLLLLCQLAYLGVLNTNGLRDFRSVSRRRPADWQFTGDPAPLARDNMYIYRSGGV